MHFTLLASGLLPRGLSAVLLRRGVLLLLRGLMIDMNYFDLLGPDK